MRRLPVTESSNGYKYPTAHTSATTQRNRLMSWGSPVQGFTKPGDVTPNSKSLIIITTLGFVIEKIKFLSESLAKLPYELFKFGYEIAKLFTRGLSRIRRLLSGSKETR